MEESKEGIDEEKSADLRCIWKEDLVGILGGIRVHSTTSERNTKIDEGTIH